MQPLDDATESKTLNLIMSTPTSLSSQSLSSQGAQGRHAAGETGAHAHSHQQPGTHKQRTNTVLPIAYGDATPLLHYPAPHDSVPFTSFLNLPQLPQPPPFTLIQLSQPPPLSFPNLLPSASPTSSPQPPYSQLMSTIMWRPKKLCEGCERSSMVSSSSSSSSSMLSTVTLHSERSPRPSWSNRGCRCKLHTHTHTHKQHCVTVDLHTHFTPWNKTEPQPPKEQLACTATRIKIPLPPPPPHPHKSQQRPIEEASTVTGALSVTTQSLHNCH